MNERDIFERALDFEDESSRGKFLSGACGADYKLREQVESLLLAHAKECRVLDERVVPAIEAGNVPKQLDLPVGSIGPYKLCEQIGEGGMGVVYVAEQTKPVQRKVAIKVIKPGMDSKEVIARFEAERQALAFMEHPNIARVLDAGATEAGHSYFVMELIRGIPITDYCDQVKLTPRERLALFTTVCDAVQHAHQKGIIHRDIKPSNVLVTQVGAKPVVKVIDFGLAKATSGQRLTDKTVYTGFMRLMGTPAYMSPEQAGLSGLDIDTRSDIYSLGVLLYELLTGTTPLDKTEIQQKSLEELCRRIREEEAPKPSTRISTLEDAIQSTIVQQRQIEPRSLRQLLIGDLDRVVLKALEKERDHRYETLKELAADIDRFLNDKPVQAIPPSPFYLARKYMRRHQVAIFTAATILALLVAATAFSIREAFRANTAVKNADIERNAAVTAKREAVNAQIRSDRTAEQRRRLLYVHNMQLADQIWNRPDGDPRQIEELLASWIPLGDGQSDLREFAWRHQWSRLYQEALLTKPDVDAIAISPAGNLVTADSSGICEWRESGRLLSHRRPGDASRAVISTNGRWAVIPADEGAKLIEIASGSLLRRLPGNQYAFSPNGRYIACWDASNQLHVQLVESDDAVIRAPLGKLDIDLPLDQHNFVLAPDGTSFILREGTEVAAFLSNGRYPVSWRRLVLYTSDFIGSFAWSKCGHFAVTGNIDGKLELRRSSDTKRQIVMGTHGKQITAIAFSADSSLMASGGGDGTIDIWNVSNLQAVGENHEPKTLASGISTGNDLSKGRSSSRVQNEIGAAPELVHQLKAHVDDIRSLVLSNDGSKLASLDSEGIAKFWDLKNLDRHEYAIEKLTEDSASGRIGVEWEAAEDRVHVAYILRGGPAARSGKIELGDRLIAVSDDTNPQLTDVSGMDDTDVLEQIEVGPYGSKIRLYLERTGSNQRTHVDVVRNLKRDSAFRLAFAPDGKSLTVAGYRVGATTWTANGEGMKRHPALGPSVAYSSDHRFLALTAGAAIQLWDRRTDQLYETIEARVGGAGPPANRRGGTLAFSSDSKYLAIGTCFPFYHKPRRSDLRVWECDSLNEIGSPLHVNDHVITSVLFTPDGRWLVGADHSGVIRIWSTVTWKLERKLELEQVLDLHEEYQGPDWQRELLPKLTAMDISDDGKTLAVGLGGYESKGSSIVLMDFETGECHRIMSGHARYGLDFSPDGRTIVSTGGDHNVVLWDVSTGMRLRALQGHNSSVCAVAFSPDGKSLATAAMDHVLRIWKAPSLDDIDRHPMTLRSMFRLGALQNMQERYSVAELTLRRTLLLQEATLPSGHPDIIKTQAELEVALNRQRKSRDPPISGLLEHRLE